MQNALDPREQHLISEYCEEHMVSAKRPTLWNHLTSVMRLRCPNCGTGRLFSGWIAMNKSCPDCQMDLVREPGFYLGSIYFNYGMTVLLVVPTYMVFVLGYGYPREIVVWPCAAFTAVFPIWFYRYARAMWLGVMYRVSSIDFHCAGDPQTAITAMESRETVPARSAASVGEARSSAQPKHNPLLQETQS